ncbi:MAG: methylmalonyl Co-A mutase-associated GTPase MeaB [Myxococcota bacterium]|nr:methylmalonyl Co-A mutase-associated GTPase MeaB [Myxococcota bacterium]
MQVTIDAILSGNRRALGRHLRGLDDRTEKAFATQRQLLALGRRSRTIGVTGSPGVGKSTLTDRLIKSYRRDGERVAVIAVDPSSPFSGGAILGDRIRMQGHHADPDTFVRSVATRGALGGLAASIRDMVDAVSAAGFGVVIIETVGVGQDEIDIVHLAQTNVVVELPGAGDGIQAIKAGLLEIADLFVVNKCDRPGAEQAVRQLSLLLDMEKKAQRAWAVPVLQTNALSGEGLESLRASIDDHQRYLDGANGAARRRQDYLKAALREALRAAVNERVERLVENRDVETLERLDSGALPYDVARDLLGQILRNED